MDYLTSLNVAAYYPNFVSTNQTSSSFKKLSHYPPPHPPSPPSPLNGNPSGMVIYIYPPIWPSLSQHISSLITSLHPHTITSWTSPFIHTTSPLLSSGLANSAPLSNSLPAPPPPTPAPPPTPP